MHDDEFEGWWWDLQWAGTKGLRGNMIMVRIRKVKKKRKNFSTSIVNSIWIEVQILKKKNHGSELHHCPNRE